MRMLDERDNKLRAEFDQKLEELKQTINKWFPSAPTDSLPWFSHREWETQRCAISLTGST